MSESALATLANAAIPTSTAVGIGLMSMGFYGRLASIIGAILGLNGVLVSKQTVLNSLEEKSGDEKEISKTKQQVDNLGQQLKHTVHRAYLMRRTLLSLFVGFTCLFLGSFFDLLAYYASGFWYIAIAFVMLAMISILVGIFYASRELVTSLENEEIEHKMVDSFGIEDVTINTSQKKTKL